MPDNNIFKLTKREFEVAELITHGYTNKQIAEHINIHICTVKAHIHSIMQKLKARNRTNISFLFLKHLKFL